MYGINKEEEIFTLTRNVIPAFQTCWIRYTKQKKNRELWTNKHL